MAGTQLPSACLKGTIHYTEDFMQELEPLVENVEEFLVELTMDTVCFHLADCLLKHTDRHKPGLTLKLIFYSPSLYTNPDLGLHYKQMLGIEIKRAINDHPKIKHRFIDREVVHLNLTQAFSFSSYF
ncbi:E4-ORFD [Bat mastadenovirus]|uniref:E4-ORFD n=1 Tax=Bat mastadenovirus TaxID=740971 RepID=A0A3G9EY17_9ADEN|nr:E4-ORFD [Bat mastadenovirus]BBE29325.1 E4-ORFD [Bat mastadenovirus]